MQKGVIYLSYQGMNLDDYVNELGEEKKPLITETPELEKAIENVEKEQMLEQPTIEQQDISSQQTFEMPETELEFKKPEERLKTQVGVVSRPQQVSIFGEKVDTIEELRLKYIVPPFSVFDTRQGYWQQRKRYWYNKINFTGQGLGENLWNFSDTCILNTINKGRSLFDPVLTEAIVLWYCPVGGKILDPFGGEAVKGIVSSKLNRRYYAVEIRKEQVEENNNLANINDVKPTYVQGDSNDIFKLLSPYGKFNLCFTSPPYYDLEVYSKEDMSALGSYEEFMRQYENIFKQCYDLLKDNSFLVIKVGEIRDKKTGEYRGFMADNINIMKRIGFKFYNDIVLVNAIGSAPMRANNLFRTRKVVHLHQNIFVFYKGSMNNHQNTIKELFNAGE